MRTSVEGLVEEALGGGGAVSADEHEAVVGQAPDLEHPELVDHAAAHGRALYCWTVDHYEDVRYCADLGVGWVATNHPGRTKDWLQNGLTGAGRDSGQDAEA